MSISEDLIKRAGAAGARQWRVWEWVNGKFERIVQRKNVHRPTSLKSLWKSIFDREIVAGDYIEFRNKQNFDTYWYISEWVPRIPGLPWINDGFISLPTSQISESLSFPFRKVDGYTPHSHWEAQYPYCQWSHGNPPPLCFNQRIGSYRPSLKNDRDIYALVGICTALEYCCDLSFPIILSNEAYKRMAQFGLEKNAVEFEGVVQVVELDWSSKFRSFLKAVGAQSDPIIQEVLSTPVGLPCLQGHIISPLDFSVRLHSTHPTFTLRVDGYNVLPETKNAGIVHISRYLVTDPSDLKDRMDDNSFLLGLDIQNGTNLVPINDFDARLRRYSCIAPIAVNPNDDPSIIETIGKVVTSNDPDFS